MKLDLNYLIYLICPKKINRYIKEKKNNGNKFYKV